ncbi:MAG: thioredoxin domain-containing protein, partial [Myxococcota bacterium]
MSPLPRLAAVRLAAVPRLAAVRLVVPLQLALSACGGASGAGGPATELPLPSTEEALATRGAPSRGPDDALVTLVEFSDFECPYCARAATVVEGLRARFEGDLRVAFRHFPLSFHERARPAHEAAVEVRAQGGDDAFWAFHDAVYASRDLSLGGLVRAAEAAGANGERVRQTLRREVHAAAVDDDLAAGVALGVTGTPTFLLNGRLVLGAPAPDAFAALIDEARAEAAALVASGVPRADASARITEALGGPAPDPELAEPLAVPDDAPRAGPEGAPITLHVFV